ncbi:MULTISPECIES: AAA family ATPase [Pseudomonas]|uniref:AAA+ ATPase domain-containing protein n=1 Tax=Pseudomonas putida S13.1.2 TaxID=1384061 RepID=A0AAU8RWP5_PSEPU|nr:MULTISPECIES: AAA family ATPase [Pseudomonas]AJQ48248.1 hypothetical protein N805_13910 [Pseudomonas putida S13.1.2]
MKVLIKSAHKSIPKELYFTLPSFSIITGLNGSGKTHLLEAMANPQLSELTIEGQTAQNISLIPYNSLTPQITEASDNSSIIDTIQMYWSDISHHLSMWAVSNPSTALPENIIEDYLAPAFGTESPGVVAVKRFIKHTGKKATDMGLEDFHNFIDITYSKENLFASQCAMAFKDYQRRRFKNEVSEYLSAKYPARNISYLSQEDFSEVFGPPPWELMNQVLETSGLPYRFNDPGEDDPELPYTLRLINQINGRLTSASELSSGEKVILALVLAIYNTGESGTKNKVILLDEPDAPLHPNFSKMLIDTIKEIIVGKSGVTVVMTTHSPTTVALAPENSIFDLDRSSKHLTMVSGHRAVQVLTKGIPHLRVSYENRRQIFVEGRYDVEYYSYLFQIINRDNRFNYTPIFVEPHSGDTNCSDVIAIVKKLRESGNDLAWGIIDYDNNNKSSDSILVLGENKRYAIDNYILDPIFICLALIRTRKKTYYDFGLSTGKTSYTEASNLRNDECQIMINSFLIQCGFDLINLETVHWENGFKLEYPGKFIQYQGHDYEKLITTTFAALMGLRKNNRESGLKLAILDIIDDFRGFIPVEISQTLRLIQNT